MIDSSKYQAPTQTRVDPYYNPKPYYQVAFVKGRKGAENFPMAPGSSVVLLDSDNPIMWFTTADSGGTITAEPFDYSEHIEKREISTEDLYVMMASLTEKFNKLEERIDGKPDIGKTSAKRSKPADAAERFISGES